MPEFKTLAFFMKKFLKNVKNSQYFFFTGINNFVIKKKEYLKMKVTFELQQVDALAALKKYAESKNTTIDKIIDQALVKIALNLKANEENKCSVEEIYCAKLDHYPINDYVKEKLKFKYILLKDRNSGL